MRWPRTLSLYVAREIVLFGSLSFIGVILVLLSQQLLDRLENLMEVGIGSAEFPSVFLFTLSMLAVHAIPIAFAFGVTLAIGRLQSNSEVLALRSLGIGLGAVLGPALAIGAAITVGTAWLMADVEPHARLGLRQLIADVALRGTIVQDGRFRGMRDRVIYADSRSPEGELRGVMLYDSTDPERPYVTFAESGSLRHDRGILELSLQAGQIMVDPDARDPERVQLVSFDEFDYSFEALSLLRGRYRERNPDELDNDELRESIRRIKARERLVDLRRPDPESYELELYRRQAMPLAPVLFAAVSVGLGTGRRRSRGLSLVACAVTVFGYYGSMTLGMHLAAEGMLDPRLACGSPAIAFGAIGALLVRRASRSAGE